MGFKGVKDYIGIFRDREEKHKSSANLLNQIEVGAII